MLRKYNSDLYKFTRTFISFCMFLAVESMAHQNAGYILLENYFYWFVSYLWSKVLTHIK